MRYLLILAFLCVGSLSYSQEIGINCANVNYFSSNTKTLSSYRLIAEVYYGRLIQLNFPIDEHIYAENFGNVEIEDNVAIAYVFPGNMIINSIKGMKKSRISKLDSTTVKYA